MLNYTVEELPVESIDLGVRGRKEYNNIQELASSIQTKGLMHNIVVYRPDGLKPQLIAGGRRLKAISDVLKWKVVPCRVYTKPLSELELKSLELEENLQRENLTFVEDVNLKREIHNLQLAIHGQKIAPSDTQGHTMEDTARMLGVDRSTLSLDMKLAKAMEEFPDVQWDRCKNKSEAMKMLNTINTSIVRMERASDVEKSLGTMNQRVQSLHQSYIVGDFFDKVLQCPDHYFDLIELDPPYGIDLTGKKKGYTNPGYNKGGYNEIPADKYTDFMLKTFQLCYSKAAPNSWMICWFGPDPWFDSMRQWAEMAGWETTGLVGIWAKGKEDESGLAEANAGQTHMPLKRLANAYEMFYYMWKGDPSLNKPGRSNVFSFKPVPHTSKTHPTERPLELMGELLTTFGQPGARVLVPFAGSGNTLISSMLNNMSSIGFDLTQSYKDSFTCRVQEVFG